MSRSCCQDRRVSHRRPGTEDVPFSLEFGWRSTVILGGGSDGFGLTGADVSGQGRCSWPPWADTPTTVNPKLPEQPPNVNSTSTQVQQRAGHPPRVSTFAILVIRSRHGGAISASRNSGSSERRRINAGLRPHGQRVAHGAVIQPEVLPTDRTNVVCYSSLHVRRPSHPLIDRRSADRKEDNRQSGRT